MARRLVTLTLAAGVLAAAGCGGGRSGGPDTSVVVTRDFGGVLVAPPETVPASAGLTAMRQLQSVHKATTAYGGRYVESINGVKEDGDSSWLVYVDGVEIPVGAAAQRLVPGQDVQWDFHAWQSVRTGGAIVGAFPQPLRRRGVRVVCVPVRSAACRATRSALGRAGVPTGGRAPVRVVVGPYRDIRGLDGVRDLTGPGESNGAFASFSANARRIGTYAADGSVEHTLTRGAGLLAAFADGRDVTWVVTGTDAAGTARAARLLADPGRLRNRFAVATDRDRELPLPGGAGR
jgi:hypothetical protein